MIALALDKAQEVSDDESKTNTSVVTLSLEVIIAICVTAVICTCIFCIYLNCHTRAPPAPPPDHDCDSEELLSLRHRDRVSYRMSKIRQDQEVERWDTDSLSEDTKFLIESTKFFQKEDFKNEDKENEMHFDRTPRRSHPRCLFRSSMSRKHSRNRSWSKSSPRSWKSMNAANEPSRSRAVRSRHRSILEGMSEVEDLNRSREEEISDDYRLGDGPLELVDKSHLDFVSNIATGSFGTVDKMEWKREGCTSIIVAVKRIYDEKIFRDELKLANIPPHKNVVQFLGHIHCSRCDPFGIVMHFYEMGNLKDLLNKKPSREHEIEPKDKRVFMIDIAKGINHLHDHKIIHRDIATRNILVTKGLRAVVSDFGFSRTLLHKGIQQETCSKAGPNKWKAPEAIEGKYNEKSDVYSFGMTCYEILEHRPPFKDLPGDIAIERIVRGDRPRFYQKSDIRAIFPGVLEVIKKCWAHRSSDRPYMDEVLNMLKKVEVSSIYQPFRGSGVGVNRDTEGDPSDEMLKTSRKEEDYHSSGSDHIL